MSHEIRIPIGTEYVLTEFDTADESALVTLLDDPLIYATTLRIPSPYTPTDAQFWIGYANQMHGGWDHRSNWAIRDVCGRLIGGIGFILTEGVWHRAEVGYWVGSQYWGRGIASRAVAKVCQIGFGQFGFCKITALVFDGNAASDRVLLKNHFHQEGFLRDHFCKNRRYFDAKLYGRLADPQK